MNTRINKTLSVLAVIGIVASSFVWTLPVAASTPGDAQFTKQDIPSTTDNVLLGSSQIMDIAVGADGKTIYVANAADPWIFKSTDGGMSFTSIKNNYSSGALATTPNKISVAPDDVNTVAVVDALNNVVISKDGGTTWSALPKPNVGATGTVTGISVAPARSGTLLGREYVVSIADPSTSGTPLTGAMTANVTGASAFLNATAVYTVNYVDQAATPSVSPQFTIPVNATAGTTVSIPFASGDTGVFRVTGVNVVNAANVTATDTFDILSGTTSLATSVIGNTGAFTPGTTVASGVSGDVQIIGGNAGWATVSSAIAGVADFTSVEVSPNFLGDRAVVAVGTGPVAGSTALYIINTSTSTIVVTGGVKLDSAGTTTNYAGPTIVGTSIISSSIALPSNFDPTTSSGRRAYVGFASGGDDMDVYRVDNDSVKALGAVTNAAVNSIAYAGTVDSGTLFVGQKTTSDVKYSKNMTAASPDWTTTLKGPIGDTATPNVLLAAASDFATTNKVFAGTTGADAGFSISTDAGVSFVQKALIAGDSINKPSLSFTGNTLFLSSVSTSNPPRASLWQTTVPFTTTSWSRIWVQTLDAGAGISVKLNPAYSTTPAIIVFETAIANAKIWVSQDGGVSFANRNAPTPIYANAALRDAQTVYFVGQDGGLYKSTNAAWTWNTVVSTGVVTSNGANITLPKANQVIVGGTEVAISTDDGATFTSFTAVPNASGSSVFALSADAKYSDNNILYVADTKNVNGIYRIKTDNTSNTWESLSFPTASQILGLTGRSGALYATLGAGIVRTLNPSDQISNTNQNWQTIDENLPGTIAGGVTTTAGINLYVRIVNDIYAYNDFLATTKPALTTPADNYAEPINPSTGFGNPIDLKWSPMGNGTSQVVAVDIEIADKANGLTGQPTLSAVNIASANPFVTINGNNLFPNHSYLWRVRAAKTASGQLVDSPWSDSRTINVQAGGIVNQPQAGVILQGPQPGASNVDPNLVGFSWAPVSGATEYQIIVATDAALTKTVAGTPAKVTTTSYQATGLTAGTTYFWAVQATQPTVSQQSVGTFTTAPKAQPSTGGTGNQTGGGGGAQTIVVNQPAPETPAYIWAVIAIGAILIIAVIILIVRTRRVP